VPSKIEWDEVITVSQAKAAAQGWLSIWDESLTELKQDHVDAYYFMGQNNVSTIQSEEMHRAFEQAKAQGKVDYLGLSTHQNAENVLAAAIETKQFDLAMIAITPGGWYDWNDRSILEGSPKMNDLRPLLDKARAAGMGLIGMKAGRFLAGRKWLGWGNPDVFNKYYDRPLLEAKIVRISTQLCFCFRAWTRCGECGYANHATSNRKLHRRGHLSRLLRRSNREYCLVHARTVLPTQLRYRWGYAHSRTH